MFDFITTDSFDIEKTNQYKLSIQVSLDGFSFLSVQPSENKIVACKNTPLNISNEKLIARHLKEWLETEDFLRNPFKEVSVFIFSEKFTIIPNEFFSDEYSGDLASVLFEQNTDYTLIENKVESINAHLHFPVLTKIFEVLQLYFTNAQYFHPLTKLLQIPLFINKRNRSVIITFKNYFYLIVLRNNHLLLANSFQISHHNDLVYNIINTFQQLETARSETDLFIADVFTDNTEIIRLLKPYFENIMPLKTDELVVNSEITTNRFLLCITQN